MVIKHNPAKFVFHIFFRHGAKDEQINVPAVSSIRPYEIYAAVAVAVTKTAEDNRGEI